MVMANEVACQDSASSIRRSARTDTHADRITLKMQGLMSRKEGPPAARKVQRTLRRVERDRVERISPSQRGPRLIRVDRRGTPAFARLRVAKCSLCTDGMCCATCTFKPDGSGIVLPYSIAQTAPAQAVPLSGHTVWERTSRSAGAL